MALFSYPSRLKHSDQISIPLHGDLVFPHEFSTLKCSIVPVCQSWQVPLLLFFGGEITRRMKKSQPPFLPKHKSSVIAKERIYLQPAIVPTLFCLLIFLFLALCLVNVMLNLPQNWYTQLAFYTQEKARIERTRCALKRASLQGEDCLNLCRHSMLHFPVCPHSFLPL